MTRIPDFSKASFVAANAPLQSGSASDWMTPEGIAVKPIYTEAQIVSFYDARRRGEYRGREQEAAQIEQMINLAIAEGRVQ